MSKFNDTKEYLEKLGQVGLSEISRARMMKDLESYVDFHAADERIEDPSRSIKQVGQVNVWQTILFKFNRKTMPVFVMIALLLVGGSTSLAAEASVPGDVLYPVKIHFTENIKSAFAVGANAEARLQAELLAERIEEAEELEANGRLNGALAIVVESNIATQYERAHTANLQADIKTDSTLKIALGRLATLTTSGDVAMDTAIDSSSRNKSMSLGAPAMFDAGSAGDSAESGYYESDAAVSISTSMAVAPVALDYLYKDAKVRLSGLLDLLKLYESEFDADLRISLQTTLSEANNILVTVNLSADDEVNREKLYKVADLIAKVEAALSALWVVEIDYETGVITDIDFSQSPEIEPDFEGGVVPMPMPVPPDFLGAPSDQVDEMIVETEISI